MLANLANLAVSFANLAALFANLAHQGVSEFRGIISQFSVFRGLPQGGVLSPFLWLKHINCLLQSISRQRAGVGAGGDSAHFRDNLCADDVDRARVHPDPGVLES